MNNVRVIVCLWIATVGILQTPTNKGTAKNNSAGGASQTAASTNTQRNSAAAPDQIVVPSQKIEPPTDKAKTGQSSDDIEIQRRLAEYTKNLVWVGIGQAVVLALTLVVIGLQAKLMRTHAEHLKSLAGAAESNAIAAGGQLKAMQAQLAQMESSGKQTDALIAHAGEQVQALHTSVGAMFDSVEASRKIAAATFKVADAAKESNRQTAEFFKAEKRPWIGMIGTLSLLEKKSTKPGQYEFTVGYTIKNFGVAPAFNTIVVLGATVEDGNNYELVKSKVEDARETGENILTMTGDLLLPGAEKTDTYHFGESPRRSKFIIPGCIVYRFADGTVHHTELSYWIDFNEGEKAIFRTVWFQAAD